MRVGLLPMGPVPRDLLAWLSDALASYGVVSHVLAEVPLPKEAYDSVHGQYDADVLVKGLSARPREGTVLAITAEDLVSDGLNFVFGLASSGQGLAVVSVYRLGMGGERRLRERLLKEAVHELGHTLGLPHCANAGCVMHFSNSVADTDRKAAAFCDDCRGGACGRASGALS